MASVKKRIREIARGGQHWDLPELIKKRGNPLLRGWGKYFKTGNSRMHFQEHRQLRNIRSYDHASEEAQEARQGMEGPSTVVVLRLPRFVQTERTRGRWRLDKRYAKHLPS